MKWKGQDMKVSKVFLCVGILLLFTLFLNAAPCKLYAGKKVPDMKLQSKKIASDGKAAIGTDPVTKFRGGKKGPSMIRKRLRGGSDRYEPTNIKPEVDNSVTPDAQVLPGDDN